MKPKVVLRQIKVALAQHPISARLASSILRHATRKDHRTTIFSQRLMMAMKTRLHVVSRAYDYDITYIQHRRSIESKPLDTRLLLLLGECATAMALNHLEQGIEKADEVSQETEPHDLFRTVPELNDSQNHYYFLFMLAKLLRPHSVIEVGTASGTSLAAFLLEPSVNMVYTFDPVAIEENQAWLSHSSSHRVRKFLSSQSSRWVQSSSDLSQNSGWDLESTEMLDASLVLVDASHTGTLEFEIARQLESRLQSGTIVVWDDIRISSMVKFWEELHWPKIEAGGLGHNSGTGLSRIP